MPQESQSLAALPKVHSVSSAGKTLLNTSNKFAATMKVGSSAVENNFMTLQTPLKPLDSTGTGTAQITVTPAELASTSSAIPRRAKPVPTSGSKAIGVEQVTPELAAEIVKKMILPMFDQKYARQSAQAGSGVFNELKLSEQLSTNLQSVRDKLDRLTEVQQDTEQELRQLQLKYRQLERENKRLREKVFKIRTLNAYHYAVKQKHEY